MCIFQAYCEAKEAYLAEIESLDENKWIQQFIYSMGKTTYTFDIETKIPFLEDLFTYNFKVWIP